MRKGINIKLIFPILWFFFFLTRILVLTNNYNLPISASLIQIGYCILLTAFLLLDGLLFERAKIKKYKNVYLVLFLLFIHTILWGIIFVNPLVKSLTFKRFKTQIVFLTILAINIYVIIKYNLRSSYIKASFYVLSLVLLFAFFINIDQLNLSNISNIFNKDSRTRSNFGLGHYNNLGAISVCNIIMFYFICKGNRKKYIYILVLGMIPIISFLMLLCSASRTSLIGLFIFLIICIFCELSGKLAKNEKILLYFVQFIFIFILFVILINIDYHKFLLESQRLHIFTQSLPIYLSSGRIFIGLGAVSNLYFGMNATPYQTYWLDNGYIYTLITTGVLGALIYIFIIFIIFKGLIKSKDTLTKQVIFPLYIMYLFICLFEASLFDSGGIINYIYLILFIASLDLKKEKIYENRNFNISCCS